MRSCARTPDGARRTRRRGVILQPGLAPATMKRASLWWVRPLFRGATRHPDFDKSCGAFFSSVASRRVRSGSSGSSRRRPGSWSSARAAARRARTTLGIRRGFRPPQGRRPGRPRRGRQRTTADASRARAVVHEVLRPRDGELRRQPGSVRVARASASSSALACPRATRATSSRTPSRAASTTRAAPRGRTPADTASRPGRSAAASAAIAASRSAGSPSARARPMRPPLPTRATPTARPPARATPTRMAASTAAASPRAGRPAATR